MDHILDLDVQKEALNNIFKKIAEGNSILFLGAGASVGEKRYLSKEVIEYYETYLGKEYNEQNITKFLDILSADPSFDRDHFDSEVLKMLQKYEVTEAHEIMASIEWREIITTNYDLLVENAFDKIKQTSKHAFDLVTIRNQKEYNLRVSNSEIKYVKLNGCASDKRKYPFAFSSDDFNKLNGYYRYVLNDLKNLSDSISLISVGYSFSDDFGKQLLEKYDSFNYRGRRWIFNIDPFPNENALHYYSQNRICIIKSSFQEFFTKYNEWKEINLESIVKKKRISFTNSKNSQISIPNSLAINLGNVIKQLDSRNRDVFVKDVDFYKGEEPNYDIIKRDVDVVKQVLYKKASNQIEEVLESSTDLLLPIFFLKGDFGIGKSTFTLRLINELIKTSEIETLAFEVLDFQKLKKEYFVDLFNFSNAKRFILFCDEVEVESSFKAILELRRELSIEQFNDFQVIFLIPIRGNILAKYKLSRSIKGAYDIEVEADLNDDEVDDLLSKLKSCNLIEYRDESQKGRIKQKIKQEYQNDSFISLMQLVTNGRHVNDLISAYNQLSSEAQKAFIYTALLHQFKLLMPAGWLRQIVSLNWDEFIEKVVKAEGRGILIQERNNSYGTDPDLYFKTKHPLIAKELINKILSSKDKQYKYFEKMFNTVDIGTTGSYLVNNLLKTLVRSEYYSTSKVNKLHDIAYTKLSDEPYFLLNYAINLQSRKLKSSLTKALDILIYAESKLDRRNHRFIHRRAVINFELTKIHFKEEQEGSLNFTHIYLDEARELFHVKQLADPCSAYSYVDYIRLLIWEISALNFSEEEELSQRIKIEELIEFATNAVTEDINRIINLKEEYLAYLEKNTNDAEYKVYLDEMYEDNGLRPYACILMFNYYLENREDEWEERCMELVDEMHYYTDNNEVVKFLVKFYGRRLYNANNRVRFFELCNKHSFIEEEIPLRYYYFKSIAESYDYHFEEARNSLKKIKGQFYGLNPSFHYLWCDDIGEESVFSGRINQWYKTKRKCVKIESNQQFFPLIKGDYSNYNIGDSVLVKLHFYLYGIMAEIVKVD